MVLESVKATLPPVLVPAPRVTENCPAVAMAEAVDTVVVAEEAAAIATK